MRKNNIKRNKQKICIIIPFFNEQKYLDKCLRSINSQSIKPNEIICINDGSTDKSLEVTLKYNLTLINSIHQGPGASKNTGNMFTNADILVFIDGDMYLDKYYIKEILKPILFSGEVASYTMSESVANFDNIWAKCWSINSGLSSSSRINLSDPNLGLAIRAIKRSYFNEIGGFNPSWGYTDDQSLLEHNKIAFPTKTAICYHYNPDNLLDVFLSARWMGKSKLFKCSLKNLKKYSIFNSFIVSVKNIIAGAPIMFLLFKLIFDFGIITGLLLKNKYNNLSK